MNSTGPIALLRRYIFRRTQYCLRTLMLGFIFCFAENVLAIEGGVKIDSASEVVIESELPSNALEGYLPDSEPQIEAGQRSQQEALPDVVHEPDAGFLKAVDSDRDYLSEKIVTYAKNIDQFFGDERYFQENNDSVIQLEMREVMEGGGNHSFAFEGKAKLDLPAATRRFQFVIESSPEKKTTGEVNKNQTVATNVTPKPEQYAASLRYEKSEIDHWHFSSESGANIQFPLDPFIRARGSYEIPFWDWRLKVAETLFWFNTSGLGETTQVDFEHVLSKPVLFRATSTATCHETTQICDLRQDLALFHTLNERTALLYQASVIGTDKPVLEETGYVLLMRYRYRLHKEWVFFEISPQLNFPKTDDFKLNGLLLLRLEFLLGGKH